MFNVALYICKDVSRKTTFALKVHFIIIIFTKMAKLQLFIPLEIVSLHDFLLDNPNISEHFNQLP